MAFVMQDRSRTHTWLVGLLLQWVGKKFKSTDLESAEEEERHSESPKKLNTKAFSFSSLSLASSCFCGLVAFKAKLIQIFTT